MELREGESLTVSVTVRNAGTRRGSEVVQVYVRDVESALLRPEKELKGFARVTLDPGETRRVSIVLGDGISRVGPDQPRLDRRAGRVRDPGGRVVGRHPIERAGESCGCVNLPAAGSEAVR